MKSLTGTLNHALTCWRSLNWPLFWKLARVLAICAGMLVLFRASTPPPGDLYTGVGAHARDSLFNYVGWELDALVNKAFDAVFGVQAYMAETNRSDVVRRYMTDLDELFRLEDAITGLYVDPAVDDPEAASAEYRAARETLRADLLNRQGTVESIIQEQIAVVLADEGLAFLGQVLPPVALRFTPLPDVIIISPRDEIRVSASLSLEGLPADRREALETAVDADLDVASLVVDIGGMALYPSMVGETDYLGWSIETAAHEWVHHYLFFYPLGLNYFDDTNPDTRAINETTAETMGKEIAREVFRRYYPELVPPEPPPAVDQDSPPPPTPTPDPDAFSLSAEMHETRITVDDLLAEGRVQEAEAYMEERRVFFNTNGYAIRKINQAYFAFYGGYQSEDNFGTAGDDPIGPAVTELRGLSASLADFLATVRVITTTEQLLAAVETARGETP